MYEGGDLGLIDEFCSPLKAENFGVGDMDIASFLAVLNDLNESLERKVECAMMMIYHIENNERFYYLDNLSDLGEQILIFIRENLKYLCSERFLEFKSFFWAYSAVILRIWKNFKTFGLFPIAINQVFTINNENQLFAKFLLHNIILKRIDMLGMLQQRVKSYFIHSCFKKLFSMESSFILFEKESMNLIYAQIVFLILCLKLEDSPMSFPAPMIKCIEIAMSRVDYFFSLDSSHFIVAFIEFIFESSKQNSIEIREKIILTMDTLIQYLSLLSDTQHSGICRVFSNLYETYNEYSRRISRILEISTESFLKVIINTYDHDVLLSMIDLFSNIQPKYNISEHSHNFFKKLYALSSDPEMGSLFFKVENRKIEFPIASIPKMFNQNDERILGVITFMLENVYSSLENSQNDPNQNDSQLSFLLRTSLCFFRHSWRINSKWHNFFLIFVFKLVNNMILSSNTKSIYIRSVYSIMICLDFFVSDYYISDFLKLREIHQEMDQISMKYIIDVSFKTLVVYKGIKYFQDISVNLLYRGSFKNRMYISSFFNFLSEFPQIESNYYIEYWKPMSKLFSNIYGYLLSQDDTESIFDDIHQNILSRSKNIYIGVVQLLSLVSIVKERSLSNLEYTRFIFDHTYLIITESDVALTKVFINLLFGLIDKSCFCSNEILKAYSSECNNVYKFFQYIIEFLLRIINNVINDNGGITQKYFQKCVQILFMIIKDYEPIISVVLFYDHNLKESFSQTINSLLECYEELLFPTISLVFRIIKILIIKYFEVYRSIRMDHVINLSEILILSGDQEIIIEILELIIEYFSIEYKIVIEHWELLYKRIWELIINTDNLPVYEASIVISTMSSFFPYIIKELARLIKVMLSQSFHDEIDTIGSSIEGKSLCGTSVFEDVKKLKKISYQNDVYIQFQ